MSMVQTHKPSESLPVAPEHRKVTWTEEADAILREEWSKATPAREIAAMLTAKGFPQTKNGILGRARRMKLGKHENASTPRPVIYRPDFSKPLPPNGCRFIDGDACGWQSKWCDAPIEEIGGSWCERHRAIVFRPKTEAEVQAAAGVFKNQRAA